MGAMNDSEEEEDMELDLKSPEKQLKKDQTLLAELHVAKELTYDAWPASA